MVIGDCKMARESQFEPQMTQISTDGLTSALNAATQPMTKQRTGNKEPGTCADLWLTCRGGESSAEADFHRDEPGGGRGAFRPSPLAPS
jgi:hypothetical protein